MHAVVEGLCSQMWCFENLGEAYWSVERNWSLWFSTVRWNLRIWHIQRVPQWGSSCWPGLGTTVWEPLLKALVCPQRFQHEPSSRRVGGGGGRGRGVCCLLCTSPKKHSDPSDFDSGSRKCTLQLPLAKGHDKTYTGKMRYSILPPTYHKERIKTDQSWRECLRIKISKWFHERNDQNSLSCFNCT